jgi:hypothetical protein
VSTSASINITVDAGAALGVVFASVHAEFNASVAKTVSTVVGNNYNVTIPPGKTAYGIYGVQVQVTTGNLDQSDVCGTTANYNSIRTYVPIAPGWCVWLSGETPAESSTPPDARRARRVLLGQFMASLPWPGHQVESASKTGLRRTCRGNPGVRRL